MAFSYSPLALYRASGRVSIIALQAAASRLVELRNTSAGTLIVPTRIDLEWLQTGAHTAAIENSIDCYKATGFTVLDTVNAVALTPSVKRTSMIAPASAAAAVRHVTVAGAAAGMTGGTLTKDSAPFAQLPQWLLAAMPTAGPVSTASISALDEFEDAYPFILAPGEGIVIENRVLLGAAAGSSLYFDIAWAEVSTY